MQKKITLNELVCVILSVVYTLMYIHPSLNKILSPYSLSILIVFNVALFLLNFKQIYINKKILFISFLEIILLLIGTLVNNTGFGSIIVIMNLLFTFNYCRYVKLDKKIVKIICVLFLLGQLGFLVLPTNIYNTNLIGYYNFLMMIFAILLFNDNKKRKLITIIWIIISMLQIYFSDSRSALMGGIVVLIMIYIIPTKLLKTKFYNVLIIGLIVGSLVFVYIYVYMWENNIEVNLSFSQKSFYSGRQRIWSELIKNFKGNEVFGVGSNYYSNEQGNNLNIHNSWFNILIIYGIPNFVLIVYIFYQVLKKANITKSKNVKILLSGIIGILIISYFENNLLSNTTSFYISMMMIFIYSYIDFEEEKNETSDSNNSIQKF